MQKQNQKEGKGFEARTVALASGTNYTEGGGCPPCFSLDEDRTENFQKGSGGDAGGDACLGSMKGSKEAKKRRHRWRTGTAARKQERRLPGRAHRRHGRGAPPSRSLAKSSARSERAYRGSAGTPPWASGAPAWSWQQGGGSEDSGADSSPSEDLAMS